MHKENRKKCGSVASSFYNNEARGKKGTSWRCKPIAFKAKDEVKEKEKQLRFQMLLPEGSPSKKENKCGIPRFFANLGTRAKPKEKQRSTNRVWLVFATTSICRKGMSQHKLFSQFFSQAASKSWAENKKIAEKQVQSTVCLAAFVTTAKPA